MNLNDNALHRGLALWSLRSYKYFISLVQKYITRNELLVVTISNDVKGSCQWPTDKFYTRGPDNKLYPYLKSLNRQGWYQGV